MDTYRLPETASNIAGLSSTNGAGGILDIFYDEWKLRLNEHPKIVNIISILLKHSFCSNRFAFQHSFGFFDHRKILMYIDRVCFRLPDCLVSKNVSKKNRLQRSLTPHLDCCPHDPSLNQSKWKPIQSFIALTDTIHPNQGGFECCPGLHARFQRWAEFRLPSAKNPTDSPPCVGAFSPIRPAEDRDIILLFEHIPCRAGDLVCWDNRIPHSNARLNLMNEAREVVYLGFLPDININRAYIEKQYNDYHAGINPTDQWVASKRRSDRCMYDFSDLGKKMMGIKPW